MRKGKEREQPEKNRPPDSDEEDGALGDPGNPDSSDTGAVTVAPESQ
jgi:hypothetical protein